MLKHTITSFASVYQNLLQSIIKRYPTKVHPRNQQLTYEILDFHMCFNASKISIYSEKTSKAFPMTFAFAELCWILSGSNQTHQMLKPLDKYSLDGIMLGSYGKRLFNQIPVAINKLIEDQDTRQCVLSIYNSGDLMLPHKDTPCNTQLQFFIRSNQLHMIITSRSSDILTGLPIDAFQWQCLYHLILNELNEVSRKPIASGTMYYNIGSLHMYAVDLEMFQKFQYSNKFEYSFSIYQGYINARERAINKFKNAKHVDDLLEIVDISPITYLTKITDIFKNRVHKISRDTM